MTDNRNAIQEYNFLDKQIKDIDEYISTLLSLQFYYEDDLKAERVEDVDQHKRAINNYKEEALKLSKKLEKLRLLRDARKKTIMDSL